MSSHRHLALGSALERAHFNPSPTPLGRLRKAIARPLPTRAQEASQGDRDDHNNSNVGGGGGDDDDDGRDKPSSLTAADSPWTIGSYLSKKKRRRVSRDGQFMVEFEDHHSPIGWESGGKVELAIRIVADETGMDALAVRKKVAELRALLPGVCELLKPAEVARLSLKSTEIADMVIRLRQELPSVNLSAVFGILAKVLLREDGVDAIVSSAKTAKEILQVDNIDSLVDREPRILQPGLVPNALNEMKRILPPGTDVAKVLVQRPEMLLSAQNLSNVDRGDRDEYYIAEMQRAES